MLKACTQRILESTASSTSCEKCRQIMMLYLFKAMKQNRAVIRTLTCLILKISTGSIMVESDFGFEQFQANENMLLLGKESITGFKSMKHSEHWSNSLDAYRKGCLSKSIFSLRGGYDDDERQIWSKGNGPNRFKISNKRKSVLSGRYADEEFIGHSGPVRTKAARRSIKDDAQKHSYRETSNLEQDGDSGRAEETLDLGLGQVGRPINLLVCYLHRQ